MQRSVQVAPIFRSYKKTLFPTEILPYITEEIRTWGVLPTAILFPQVRLHLGKSWVHGDASYSAQDFIKISQLLPKLPEKVLSNVKCYVPRWK